jgi:hypothetical protein
MKKGDVHLEQDVPPLPADTSTALFLTSKFRGGIVPDGEVACRIAEVLIEAHFDKAELAAQQPLVATDKGDYWRVEGSRNRDQKVEGAGWFFMSIKKFDGRLIDFGRYGVFHPHPSVRPLIEAARRKQKPDDTE